jgi:hypothetical protein
MKSSVCSTETTCDSPVPTFLPRLILSKGATVVIGLVGIRIGLGLMWLRWTLPTERSLKTRGVLRSLMGVAGGVGRWN